MSKTNHWSYIRSLVKSDFQKTGITKCEWPGCCSTMFLSFAHRLKRRFIADDQELRYGLALLCQTHHNAVEHKPHSEMFRIITEIMANRQEVFV